MNLTEAAIRSAATIRLTRLLTEDEISRPIREKVDAWAGNAPDESLKGRARYLVTCPACVSVWAAGLVLVASHTRPGKALVEAAALSTGALLLNSVLED